MSCFRCTDPTELSLRYSQREEMKTSTEEKVDDAILMAEVMAGARGPACFLFLHLMFQVMAAGEGQLEELVVRLRAQGVHSTHYIMVRLELR